MLNQILAVVRRVLQQLVRDRRFLALSMIAPVVIIYMIYIFFDAVNRPLFNEKEFVPGVAAFIVHFLTYVLCSIALVRERTQDTMTRMFVSGYRRSSIIGGYVIAYSLVATAQSLIVLTMLNVLFELEYTMSEFLQMYLIIWLLAIISIALGIFVSNFARNEGQVLPMIPLILVPSVFFSGMIVNVSQMPDWTQVLSYTTPMYYAESAINTVGSAFEPVQVLYLVGYGVIVMVLGVFTLREQM